jgi:transaldolase
MNEILKNGPTEIFLDSGDPAETRKALEILGFLHGQTTNPSLIAKSPEVQAFLADRKFTRDELFAKYHAIALEIRDIIPQGKISAEVYADGASTTQELIDQGRNIATWFPGIFVKLPVTYCGLEAAEILTSEGIAVNMTLCFSQEQAAAVHAATKNSKVPVFVSPFMGRLDDIGQNGSDVVANIQKMYIEWGSHVGVLGASIRSHEHIQLCLDQKIAAMTIPLKIIETRNEAPVPESKSLLPIAYKILEQKNWREYDIAHALTKKGLEKFAADWNALCE